MNRMCKMLIIGCSIWSYLYFPVNAQEEMDVLVEEAPAAVEEVDAVAEVVVDDTTTIDLLDPTLVTDQERVVDAAALAEQERVRRYSAAMEGRQALAKANVAMTKGQWALAVELYDLAQSKMQNVDMLQEELTMARDQKSEAYFQMALSIYNRRKEGGNLNEAERYLKLSAEINPENTKPAMLSKDIAVYKKRVADEKEISPIQEEEKYVNAQAKIKTLLARGRAEMEIGDYDTAENTFEQVLAYDRYNHDAFRYIEKVAELRWKAHSLERKSTVMKMMDDAEKRWLLPLNIDQRGPKDIMSVSGSDIEIAESDLENKLNNIVIEEIRFQRADISDVIQFLVQASREQDPDGIGVNIIFMDPEMGAGAAPANAGSGAAPAADPFGFGAPAGNLAAPVAAQSSIPPITLELRNVTLLDALKTVTDISGLYYRIERNMVIIEREGRGRLITRFYPVDPTRWVVVSGNMAARSGGGMNAGASNDPFASSNDPFGSSAAAPSGSGPELNSLFSKYGVKIPDGGDIAYESLISQLVVTLTPDQFPQFEEVLRKINVAPRQVEIEARFVEVLQSDLEELGFEWILTDNAELLVQDGPGAVASRPRVVADQNLQGVTSGLRFFDFDSTADNVQPTSRSSSNGNNFLGEIMSFSGILTNPELQVVIQALDQKGNSDLLSSPRVTTVHGVNAIIEVVREIIYPTEFDITENDVNVDGGGTGDSFIFLPPTVEPGGFETRNVGVILNVTPTVNADNYTINLVMLPEIAELVDWLQYGSSIPLGDGTEYLVNIPQPVFESRNITTSMIVWDGHTVVMGGLIREDLTTYEDKVPLLGDLPIIGRLFRSEGRRSEKRNLLIFVTARLVDPAGNSVNRKEQQDLVSGKGSSSITSSGGPVAIQ
ncbi:hypothetical protein P3T73_07600 [Kiritimatiellota bacterium B12222]|nr:hypothetical protein P3T73_07600 [Kiritimatiellota bacterium B12222]